MLWLALHLPKLGLEVMTEAEPGRPTVLIEENKVVMRNALALERGIGLATSLATAHSICPDLIHCAREPSLEQRRLRFVAETLYRFTSEVSMPCADALLMEISGSLNLFGSVEAIRDDSTALCESLGHRARAAVSSTPLAALALARSGAREIAEVPLDLAGVGEDVVERFANMGIYRLGAVLELPQQELGTRFGPELLLFLDRLKGEIPHPQEALRPFRHFDASLHPIDPICDKEALLFPMQRLLNDLSHWLVARQLGTTRIDWQFRSHGETASLSVGFAKAKQQGFLNVSKLKLEALELPEDVLDISLTAKALRPWEGASQSLFHTLGGEHASNDPFELVDELNARLGEGACTGIAATDQHRPELAWQSVDPHAKRDTFAAENPRPLWLFRRPHPIERTEVALLSGPERIQSNWWQTVTSRDYYVGTHACGAKCWIFVDENERWYLHGYFG